MTCLRSVRIAKTRSRWLQETHAAEAGAERIEPLEGGQITDVVIFGAG